MSDPHTVAEHRDTAAVDPRAVVWIVELATLDDARHIHGVYASEYAARREVVDLLTTRFVSHWIAAQVAIPNLVQFAIVDDWVDAVLTTWIGLVDPVDVQITWEGWETR